MTRWFAIGLCVSALGVCQPSAAPAQLSPARRGVSLGVPQPNRGVRLDFPTSASPGIPIIRAQNAEYEPPPRPSATSQDPLLVGTAGSYPAPAPGNRVVSAGLELGAAEPIASFTAQSPPKPLDEPSKDSRPIPFRPITSKDLAAEDLLPSERQALAKRKTKEAESFLGERLNNIFGDEGRAGRQRFESNHNYDYLVSPISNPFLYEDPRALTELRPIFFYQQIPNTQPLLQGGNLLMFALQGRLAITEHFSITLNKLGGVSLHPGDGSPFNDTFALTEIWLGPKYSFGLGESGTTVAAVGAIFQLGVGSGTVWQDTGDFSIVPYFSYGRQLWRSRLGCLSILGNIGYAFGSNNLRSDYLYLNSGLQLDIPVSESMHILPMLELNSFYYTGDGESRPFGFEGHDLANVGSQASGRNFMAIAPGLRFKPSERWQFGVSVSFPLTGTKDLHQVRYLIDAIWRY